MVGRKSAVVVSLLLLILLHIAWFNRIHAVGPATTQAMIDPQLQMQTWWEDLARPEPFSARALLDFSTRPDDAVVFLKNNLKPLKLEQKDLQDLLHDLGSDDEKVWKPAFEKMQYLDPRLAGDIDALLDAAPEQPARNRLIEILSDYTADQLKGSSVNLRQSGVYRIFYMTNANGGRGTRSWMVEPKVARLDTEDGQSRKKLWQRADRAIILLQHIGSPAAITVLKEMATGNPDAQPTKIARLAVDSLGAGN